MTNSAPPGDKTEQAAFWCARLADGRLPADEQVAFEAWLGEDASHLQVFERTAALWAMLPDSDDAFQSRPQPTVVRSAVAKSVVRRWQFQVPAAAALIACALFAFGLLHGQTKTYHTGPGATRTFILADGSEMVMDADSRVRIDTSGGRRRVVLESGRAEFKVHHDMDHPFSVEAASRVVVAVGTRFTVERIGDVVRIDLSEGRLAGFDHADILNSKRSISQVRAQADYLLSPGQRLSWQRARARGVTLPSPPGTAQAWEEGRLVFVDQPLSEAVAVVNRYGAARVVIASDVPATMRISGIYRAGDVETFARGAAASSGLAMRRTEKGFVLQRQR